jgi:hypothetical protein
MSVFCECCVLSCRDLCVGLITSPTECGVSECDREASLMRRLWSTRGCCTMKKKIGNRRRLRNEELLDVYPSPDIRLFGCSNQEE